MNEVQTRWREREQIYTRSQARAVIANTKLYELYSEINTAKPSKAAINALCTLLDEHPEYLCDDLKLNGDRLDFKFFRRDYQRDAQVASLNTLKRSPMWSELVGTYRIKRGGSANDSPRGIAVFCRRSAEPEHSSSLTGLRLMRRAEALTVSR